MDTRQQKIYVGLLSGLLLAAYALPWMASGGREALLQDEPGHSLLEPLRHLAQEIQAHPASQPYCLYLGDSVMYSRPGLPEKGSGIKDSVPHLPQMVDLDYQALHAAPRLAFASFYSQGFKPNDYLLMAHLLVR
jgi:hypothetical protein